MDNYRICSAADDFSIGYIVTDCYYNQISEVLGSIAECREFINDLNKALVINEISELLWCISLDDLLQMQKQIFDDMYEDDIKDLLE